MSEWLQRSFGVKPNLMTQDDGQRYFEGLAAVYYDPKDPGTEAVTERGRDGKPTEIERIMPGAFDRALRDKEEVVFVYDHDKRVMLGRSSGQLELRDSPKGLYYRCPYDSEDPDHQRGYAKLKRGDIRGSSFKFYPRPGGCYVERKNGVRYVHMTDVYLYDVCLATEPYYSSASAKARSLWDDIENEQKTADYLAKIARTTAT